MTRHARYRQVGKPTIHKATMQIPFIKTPTIDDNRKVYKQIGILDKRFSWLSPRRWTKKFNGRVKVRNVVFIEKGDGKIRFILPKEDKK